MTTRKDVYFDDKVIELIKSQTSNVSEYVRRAVDNQLRVDASNNVKIIEYNNIADVIKRYGLERVINYINEIEADKGSDSYISVCSVEG